MLADSFENVVKWKKLQFRFPSSPRIMSYAYDDQNIFAKILRGDVPCSKVLDTDHSLAFSDIAPQAPSHAIVIPKGPYVNFDHFATEASSEEIEDFIRAVGEVARILEVAPDGSGTGYRLISNAGADGHQEVPHLHLHVLGGRPLGRMISRD